MFNTIIVLGLIIYALIILFEKDKSESDGKISLKNKILRKTKKIAVTTILVLLINFTLDFLIPEGVKSIYCLSDDKCVTVLKKEKGEVVYIILGKHQGRKDPSDNYVKITKMDFGYSNVVFARNNILLVGLDDSSEAILKSSDGLMEFYRDNETLNDSLYTYFDGKSRKYKKEVNFINLCLKENYATDRNGKKL